MTLPALYLPTRWLVTADPSIDDPDVFPTLIGQSFLLAKTPTWATKIATASSGRERRRKAWSYPRWQFKLSYEVLRDLPAAPDLERLTAFFLVHAGQYQEFFFLDPGDNTVAGQMFGVGDGVTTTFQLTRSMAFGSASFSEPIEADRAAMLVVYEGSVEVGGRTVEALGAAFLGEGDEVKATAVKDARFLLIAGRPIREPVAWAGPFVMNTREEVMQAYDDFRAGRF